MAKWEYCYSGPGYRIVRFITPSGFRDERLSDEPGRDFFSVMARMGQQGWELTEINDNQWIFKRPLDE